MPHKETPSPSPSTAPPTQAPLIPAATSPSTSRVRTSPQIHPLMPPSQAPITPAIHSPPSILPPTPLIPTPTTSSNDAITILEDTTTTLTINDFGSYSDTESTPINSIKITTLETNGSLEYNNGSSWVAVTLNQEISAADINSGKLRYTPASNVSESSHDSIGFAVSDGTDYSTSNYTLTVNVTADADPPNASISSVSLNEATAGANTINVTVGDAAGDGNIGGNSEEYNESEDVDIDFGTSEANQTLTVLYNVEIDGSWNYDGSSGNTDDYWEIRVNGTAETRSFTTIFSEMMATETQ